MWSEPAQRDELARAIASDLGVAVTLRDPAGAVLSRFGGTCRGREYEAAVSRAAGEVLGMVQVCAERHTTGLHLFLPLLAAGLVLWGASGKIARRLARPLADVACVAQEIGAGRLHSRANLESRTPDEIGALAVSINDMADRIERQLHDQRVLLAAVSHELRTPLGHLRILLELIRTNGADARSLDELEREIVEIDTLVGELLASSRLDFTAITPKALDAVDLARRALERAGLSPALLSVEGGPAVPFEGDATLIARALANLLDNARRHGSGASAVVVRGDTGSVAFEVLDSGPGFPAGDGEALFLPFYGRGAGGDRPRSENGTLGLGLSLVKRIAEAHGGRAYARGRPEGGACVGFEVKRT